MAQIKRFPKGTAAIQIPILSDVVNFFDAALNEIAKSFSFSSLSLMVAMDLVGTTTDVVLPWNISLGVLTGVIVFINEAYFRQRSISEKRISKGVGLNFFQVISTAPFMVLANSIIAGFLVGYPTPAATIIFSAVIGFKNAEKAVKGL